MQKSRRRSQYGEEEKERGERKSSNFLLQTFFPPRPAEIVAAAAAAAADILLSFTFLITPPHWVQIGLERAAAAHGPANESPKEAHLTNGQNLSKFWPAGEIPSSPT